VTKQYTVRLASEQDAAQLAEWLIKTPNNLFDPDIAQYPNLRVLVVEKDGEPIIYFPFHVVFQGESLALNPDADKKHLAHGFRVLENALLALAEPYGIREVFTACADDSFSQFAERHGWTPVQHKYLRRKVAPCMKPGPKQ
jgi:N-acetylglutamate synthase-like GNAT family acetyltransferase